MPVKNRLNFRNPGGQATATFIPACLALATLIVYLAVSHFEFITYDDPDYVTTNEHVRNGLTFSGIVWAFSHTSSAEWHPVTMLSHMVDCEIFGLNPAGHHISSLAFHVANTVILYWLLLALSRTTWPSAFVAFLFALHPVNVEAVAWISERKGLLSTFFGLLCLLAYVRAVKGAHSVERQQSVSTDITHSADRRSVTHLLTTARTLYYLLAFSLLALSLLSKPMLVTWPFVMLLLDYWPLRRLSVSSDYSHPSMPQLRLLLVEKLPFLALSVASCVSTLLVARCWGAVTNAVQTPLWSRASNATIAYGLYVWKILWPGKLSISYPFIEHQPVAYVLAPLVGLAAVTTLALWQSRKRPYILMGWGWFLVTLLPVIGLVHFGNHFMADRYAYITAIGLYIILAWTFAELAHGNRFLRFGLCSAQAAILIVCALRSQSQLLYWNNTETLFRHALALDPKDFVARQNLGFDCDQHRQIKEAELFYRTALAINPGSTFALNKLSALLITLGRPGEALTNAQQSLAFKSSNPEAHCTAGLAFAKLGNIQEAIQQYQAAIQVEKNYAPAHYNLANALAAQGRFAEAEDQYRAALISDPDCPDTHSNLGYLLLRDGDYEQAASEFKAAIAVKPGMWQACYGLADVLERQRKIHEAAIYLREALRTNPEFPEALSRLGWWLATDPDPAFRNGTEAVELAEKACKLTGYTQPIALRSLAAAYAEQGQFDKACELTRKARELASASGHRKLGQQFECLQECFTRHSPYRENQ